MSTKDNRQPMTSESGARCENKPGSQAKTTRMRKPYRVIVNDDGGRGVWNWVAPLSADQYLDAVCGAQVSGQPVDALFWCGLQNPTGSANYNTRVGEVRGSRWDRFDSVDEWVLATTLREIIAGGDDPLSLICDRCHALGTDAWLSFRVNDAHHIYGGVTPSKSKTSQLFLDRPDLRMGPDHGWPHQWSQWQWDYLNPEVRDIVFDLLKEAFLDYDVDGVELDFIRHPYLFTKANVNEGAEALNGFIKSLRTLADEAEQKKGRPQGLAVRVPSYEPACAEIGLDWRTWVKEGWVDVLTASCFMAVEQEADLTPFVEGCRNSNTLVHWCVESTPSFPHVAFNQTLVYGGSPNGLGAEHYRAMALGGYEQGVDGIYFFNFHFPFERYDTHPQVTFLGEMHNPALLRERDQTYLVSRQTHDAHDTFFACAPPRPLPRTLTLDDPTCSFDITVGADLAQAAKSGRLRHARLRLCLKGMTAADVIEVSWNGQALAGHFEPPLVAGTWQQWRELHFWVAELAALGCAPPRGKHVCTVRLLHRNDAINGGIVIDFVELDVRFWHRPGMPRAGIHQPQR